MTIPRLPGVGYGAPRKRSGNVLHWRAKDLSLTALTGQLGTFSRASIATYIDRNGNICTAAIDQPRFTALDLDHDGVREKVALLYEGNGSINYVVQSDALATGWSAGGTVTATNNVGTYARRPFSRVTNLGGGALSRAISIAADGTHCVSVLLKSNGATGFSYVVLFDSTTSSFLGTLKYTVAADGSISALLTSGGTLFPRVKLADGVYLFSFSVPNCVASHANRIYANDTGGNATLASVLMSGVQVEPGTFPSSLIPTTTTTVSRSADLFSLPLSVLPRAFTSLHDAVWYVAPNSNTNFVAWRIGLPFVTPYVLGRLDGTTLQSHIQHHNGTSLVSAQTPQTAGAPIIVPGAWATNVLATGTWASGVWRDPSTTFGPPVAITPPTFGQRAELRHELAGDGSVTAALAVEGGIDAETQPSSANPLAPAWSGLTLYVGTDGGQPGNFALLSLRLAGVQDRTLDDMRQAF